MTASRLESRAWLVWVLAAMIPVMTGRNPWVLVEVLVIVLVVRAVWLPPATTQAFGWFVRIAGVMVLVGVLFNLLTVHAGDRTMGTLPESWPVVGGPITWNALVYGMLGGIALFTLVLTGITCAALMRWIDLFHALPQSLAPIAVTGSVAWAFLPQTAIAWKQIREAQAMRGHRFRRVRDFVPIIVPLLAGGLERSLTMAEALESRGFGASLPSTPATKRPEHGTLRTVVLVSGLVALATAAYSAAVGSMAWAGGAGLCAVVALGAFIRSTPQPEVRRTRYRISPWARADSVVVLASIAAGGAAVLGSVAFPEALAYRVYPELALPAVPVPLLLAIALLLAPAIVHEPGE